MAQDSRFASCFSPRNLKFAQRSPFPLFTSRLTALALVYVIVVTIVVPPVSAASTAAPASERWRLIHPAIIGFWNLLEGAGAGPQEDPPPQEEQPPADPPSQQELEARVARLELNPQGEVTLQSGQALVLEALPLDEEGNVVQGLIARWESDNSQVLSITKDGEAHAGMPGTAYATAFAGQVQASVRVIVVTAGGVATTGANVRRTKLKASARLSSHTRGRVARSSRSTRSLRSSAARAMLSPAPLQPPDADPLPDGESNSLYNPINAVGSPPGRTEPSTATPPSAVRGRERAGSANFSFDVPLVGLPGRGVDVTLALVYNSRLWNKSTTTTMDNNGVETSVTHLSYDVDNGWPATGWKLGYGQLESQGTAGFTLVDADGTRHELSRLNPSNPNETIYQTTDGTFILYDSVSHILTYTDGVRVEYGASGTNGKRSYPIKITDRNGNYLLITYRNGVGPQLATVKDTLARYVRFNYDASGRLVTVTAPHYAGGADRQVARFYYQDINVSKSFSSGYSITAPDVTSAISHIYFPGTQNGYLFNYSAYGMIYNISQRRGMVVDSTSLTTIGSVTAEGEEAASTLYNYPTLASNLADVPKFTRRTDDWAGRTTATKPFYTFSVNEGQGLTTITAPDGSLTETHTIVAEGQWNNGLVSETLVKDGANTLARTVITWEHDGSQRNPRVQKIETINEVGQSRTFVYSYTAYNNVSTMSERDWSAIGSLGAELRRTETVYETGTAWTARGLVRLAKSVKVFKGGTTLPASRTDYAYDTAGTNLTRRDDVIMHDDAYDPYAPTVTVCDPTCHPFNPYDPATDKRGNVVSVTTYSDAAAGTGASVYTYGYDIVGNVVSQEAACCQHKSYTYTVTYKYAYPTQVDSGDAGQLTTKATYDFNTGLVRTQTDENNQVTTIHYEPETLRHFKTIRPDGGYTQHEYDDSLAPDPAAPRLHSFIKTIVRLDVVGGVDRLVTSYQYLDGRGAPARTFGPQTVDGYPTVDTEYDSMGRAYRASNPYYTLNGTTDAINPSGKWTKRTFDRLGRVVQITLPDNNTIITDYAGDTVTVTDQADKQRRHIVDALGRVERTDEPDATGNLGTVAAPVQATSYVYDIFDNLVKITQGTQRRYFKYDSLSRLTHERQVEQDAPHYQPDTLTANNYWSRRYVYNADSLLTDSYDAKNIHTHFDYDGLNRVTQVTYTGESTQTPNVFYAYDQVVGSFFNKGRLTRVDTKVGSTVQNSQQYNYNKMGQVAQHTETIGAVSYTTSYLYNLAGELTKETYPAGRRAVSYSYDDAARLQTIADAARTYASGFQFAPHGGLLAETFGNSTVHSMTYNTRLQSTQSKLMSGSTVVQRYDYAYGEVDMATGAVDATKNTGQVARIEGYIGAQKQWQQRYSYDELGRLSLMSEYEGTSTTDLTYRMDYAFDRYGNRSQDGGQNTGLPYVQVRATDISAATNRYVAGTGIQYDAAGQVTADPKFRGRQYDYDANGRQRWTAQLDGTDAATATFDGMGQRVETTAGGVSTQVVYDAYGQMIAEYTGGAWTRDYIYRGGQVVATVESSGEVRYLLSDHQGSTRVVMNASGGVQARHDYLPYGEELQAGTGLRTTTLGYDAGDQTRQRYSLMERDDSSGLDHAWWRKYESESGRWTSADPYTGSMSISDPQSFNRYSYVENDPVNYVDPSGLEFSWNTQYKDGWGFEYHSVFGPDYNLWLGIRGQDGDPYTARFRGQGEFRMSLYVLRGSTAVPDAEGGHLKEWWDYLDFYGVDSPGGFREFGEGFLGGQDDKKKHKTILDIEREQMYADCLKTAHETFKQSMNSVPSIFKDAISLDAVGNAAYAGAIVGTTTLVGTKGNAPAAVAAGGGTFLAGIGVNWGWNVTKNFFGNQNARVKYLGKYVNDVRKCRKRWGPQ